VGIADLDRLETLDDDSYGEWIESYSYADNNPRVGSHPCPEADTEMLFAQSTVGRVPRATIVAWKEHGAWYAPYGTSQKELTYRYTLKHDSMPWPAD